jgi:HTH-type transcriptional regulator / antitoxin HigA
MAITFNPDKYKELLSEYQPKLIKTEAENEQALVMVEKLMGLSTRTPEQEEIYELLIMLIEKFEQEFYKPILENNPGSMLLFLMDQQNLKPSNLVSIFGSEEAVAEATSGNKMIDRSIAEQLSDLFQVDISLFV